MVQFGRRTAMVAAMALTLGAAGSASAADTLVMLASGQLVSVPADKIGSPIGSPVTIAPLASGETVGALDYRPANQKLYALAVNITPTPDKLQLYVVNPVTGATTLVGPNFDSPFANNTSIFWMSFNPVVDRLRVVGPDDKSIRLNPDTGALVATDTALFFASGDPNAPNPPAIHGVGYDNAVAGATTTTLYGMHLGSSAVPLVRIGGPGGSPSPNGGQVSTIGGNLTTTNGTPYGMDIGSTSGTAYTILGVFAFITNVNYVDTLNLATGQATQLSGGYIGGVSDFTVAPAGTLALSLGATSVNENAGPATITVNRSGAATGSATVDYTTADGSAEAGSDYTAASGTLSFADGESSKTFSIPVTDDAAVEGRESLVVELSNATGNATTGALLGRRTATVTIEDNDAAPAVTPPTITPDTTAPTATLAGVPTSLTRARFLKGFTLTVTPSEASALDVALQGKTSKATLASLTVGLFSKHLVLAPGARTVKVKPNAKGVGKVRRSIKVTLRVTATDAASNRSTISRTIKVKPDPKKKKHQPLA